MASVFSPFDLERIRLSRRGFIKFGSLAALVFLSPSPGFAAARKYSSPKKSLRFYNTHTEETLETVFWANGKYLQTALSDINYILRDHRTGEIKCIDPKLLDLLHAVNRRVRAEESFHIISGYRSPDTNAQLRACTRGIAKNSLHIQGQAIDIRVPGCSLPTLRNAAMSLKKGGVGYYPHSDFIHVDVGPVRYW